MSTSASHYDVSEICLGTFCMSRLLMWKLLDPFASECVHSIYDPHRCFQLASFLFALFSLLYSFLNIWNLKVCPCEELSLFVMLVRDICWYFKAISSSNVLIQLKWMILLLQFCAGTFQVFTTYMDHPWRDTCYTFETIQFDWQDWACKWLEKSLQSCYCCCLSKLCPAGNKLLVL